MAKRTTRTRIQSDIRRFTIPPEKAWGGLNNYVNSTQVEDTQAQDLSNVIFTNLIEKRGGYTEVNGTAISGSTGIYGLGSYYKVNGSKYMLYASHTVIGTINTGTGATASVITGLTSNERTRFKTFKDIVVITKQSDAPQKYDGTTGTVLGGSPPTCPYQEVHKNYHFLAGNATYPSRLYYSNLDDNETWTADDFIDINPDDGDIITGLHSTLDTLIISKEYSIYILYGDTPTYTEGLELWRIKRASTSTGSVNQGGIARYGKNIMYLSRNDGIQLFGGSVSSENITVDSLSSSLVSKDISPTVDGLNDSRYSQAEAIIYDYKYILSVPNGASTTNNINLVYDFRAGGWSMWTIPANCWAMYRTSGQDTLYFGSTTTGKIYQYTPTTYSDNGTAINAYYQTKDFNLGSSANDKIFRKFYVTVDRSEDYTLTVTPEVDLGDVSVSASTIAAKSSDSLWGTIVWGTDQWGAATTAPSPKNIMNARGKFINYKFSNNTLNQNMQVIDLTQFYRIRGAR